jgi:hypothetical protein
MHVWSFLSLVIFLHARRPNEISSLIVMIILLLTPGMNRCHMSDSFATNKTAVSFGLELGRRDFLGDATVLIVDGYHAYAKDTTNPNLVRMLKREIGRDMEKKFVFQGDC